MNMAEIMEFDSRAVRSVETLQKRRFLFSTVEREEGRPFVALIGPRGVGKTVMLRQLRALRDAALYVSADTLKRDDTLVDLVRRFFEGYGIDTFYIDEIHFLKEYQATLKQIYDFFPVKMFFTSSSALSLTVSTWDLSRRVLSHNLLPFTFREYLWFHDDSLLPALPLTEIFSRGSTSDYARTVFRFEGYLRGGLYPLMLEPGARMQGFEGIMQKILRTDIPASDPTLSYEDILSIEKVLTFVGRSSIDGINYSSLSRNIGITKYMAEKYVDLLQRSFLLYRAMPAGANVVREPKIFMELPYRLLFREYADCLGAIREDFFALALHQHRIPFQYLKTTRGRKTPDFLIDLDGKTIVLEVGGKGKGRTQFKEVEYTRKVVLSHTDTAESRPGPDRIPLHCLGFAAEG